MKRILLLSWNLLWTTTSFGSALTPEEVAAHIESKGTQATREKYFSCGEKDNALGYARVEAGSEVWLKIATRLLNDSDACYTEGLQDSIARALMNKPENVLPLVDSGRNLEAVYICIPFMTDTVEPTALRNQLAALNKLESSLKSVKNKKLQTQKNKCLARVQPLQSEIREALTLHSRGTR